MELTQDVIDVLEEMSKRYEELYEGFSIYDKYRETTDISLYEKALNVYRTGLAAMEQEVKLFKKLVELLE